MGKTIAKVIALALFLSFLVFPSSVLAIPSLGVAPGAPGDGDGTYLGSFDGAAYLNVFASPPGGSLNGFAFPGDGDITVWYGSDSAPADNMVDIWLVSTTNTVNSFAGTDFTAVEFIDSDCDLSVASWKKGTVYGANLGSLADMNVPWESFKDINEADAGEFATGDKDFYFLDGHIDGYLSPGEWLYAVATVPAEQCDGCKKDVIAFSPKTTAMTSVPEPAGMSLFLGTMIGTGLAGPVALRRKKLLKK